MTSEHVLEIARINRLYAALSRINQTIVRVRSREELLTKVCQILVVPGGFQMAWIGWYDDQPDLAELTADHPVLRRAACQLGPVRLSRLMRLVMSAELKTEIIKAPPFTIIAFFFMRPIRNFADTFVIMPGAASLSPNFNAHNC